MALGLQDAVVEHRHHEARRRDECGLGRGAQAGVSECDESRRDSRAGRRNESCQVCVVCHTTSLRRSDDITQAVDYILITPPPQIEVAGVGVL